MIGLMRIIAAVMATTAFFAAEMPQAGLARDVEALGGYLVRSGDGAIVEISLARTWANEQANGTMRVNIINPGAMRTQMRAKAFPGEDPNTLPEPENLVPLILELASPACQLNGETVQFRDWRGTNALISDAEK